MMNLFGLHWETVFPINQEIVPHFLDRHCADPLMRDLRLILLISVTIHFD